MRGINYAVGLGTILIFAGFYIFKALFSKNTIVNKEGEVIPLKTSPKNKVLLIISGCVCVIAGVWLILKELPIGD